MAERPVDCVILAGGKGTRMGGDLPKVLHKVCGRSMLDWVLDACEGAGIRRKIVIVGYREDMVREAVGERGECVLQEPQLGTGHAALQAAPKFKEDTECDCLVLCGDGPLISVDTLKRLVETHRSTGAVASLATAVLEDSTGYGRIVRKDGEFQRIVEQKEATEEEKAIKEVNPSYYCFKAGPLFEQLPLVKNENAKGEYYLTDVVGMLRELGGKVSIMANMPQDDILSANTPEELIPIEAVLKKRLEASA